MTDSTSTMTMNRTISPQRVPLLDLQAQYEPIRDEILAAVTRVCDSQHFILGPEVEAFERAVGRVIGTREAIGLSSGTDALLIALMALHVGPGDEVVVPAFSFFATAGVVSRLGATPVFVDIDPATFNLDVEAALAAVTSRTRAIMPVHLFGQSAELAPLVEAAGRAGVPIVEDAAQAIGATYHEQPVGTFGEIGCFSFFPTKNLGAFGDAGLVVTSRAELGDRLRILRTHGAKPKYHHALIGGNFRLDALQAAVLGVKLPRLAGWTAARRRNAARYRELFAQADLGSLVGLPVEAADRTHIYNQFVVRVQDRERLRTHLADRGIGTEVYYPVPFHQQACFASLGYPAGAFPEADRAAAEVLALPIYGELSDDQQAWVVESIRAFYRG